MARTHLRTAAGGVSGAALGVAFCRRGSVPAGQGTHRNPSRAGAVGGRGGGRVSGRRVSRFPVVALEDLPPDLRQRAEDMQERLGFVPNVVLALGHRPAELRAFLAYHDAVMEREGGLTPAEREMIVVATSAARSCTYCVVAHGAVLRLRAHDPLLPDLLAANFRTAPVTPRQAAMLRYAVLLSTTPEQVADDDLDALRAHGFSDDDLWDIGAVTAFFALSNRLAHAMDLQPNEPFHLLGRLPRDTAAPPAGSPHDEERRTMSTPEQHDARRDDGDPRFDPAAVGEVSFAEPDGDGGAQLDGGATPTDAADGRRGAPQP